jgi:hypothetical protein
MKRISGGHKYGSDKVISLSSSRGKIKKQPNILR